MKKKEKGQAGEDIAVSYLEKEGYHLIARNFTSLNSEIDVIAVKDNVLVFVEVRLKFNSDYGFPEHSMSKHKTIAIKRGAEAFLYKHPWEGKVRFDFISILESPELEVIHFKDAFF